MRGCVNNCVYYIELLYVRSMDEMWAGGRARSRSLIMEGLEDPS